MAEKLINESDILTNLVNIIAPKYFDENTLDHNRVSVFGYLSEAMAKSISDTVILEERRSEDYVPELSNSAIRVKQTAEIRGVDVNLATPGSCYAMIGVLKTDILEKGTSYGNGSEIDFNIDRRSTILYNNINFSLEDDIIIRALRKSNGTYVYTANYTGEFSTGTTLNIQSFDQVNSDNEEMIVMICQIYQYNYNIQDKIVTDDLEFLYDGMSFDYDNNLAGFDVYFKQSSSETYTKLPKISYYTTSTNNTSIYYDSNDDQIIYIYNNPNLSINVNATVRIEIKETLGTNGNLSITDSDTASFTIYKDSSYNYSGINIAINILTDIVGATDSETLSDVKKKLIDAKSRRNNITTENDILQYINDIDANVQIVKKRNDIQDRIYYLYTLMRSSDNSIAPTTTKRLLLKGIQSPTDNGDFDEYRPENERKIIRAYNKFKIITDTTSEYDNDHVIKVLPTENTTGNFYLTCPYMILFNTDNVASYYFTSVNDSILLSSKTLVDSYPYKLISRNVNIYRDSHDATYYNTYNFSISGTLNMSNDNEFVDADGNILDSTAIMCYIVLNREGTPAAYLPMPITGYNKNNREFTFSSNIKTSDYITEREKLEITQGLYEVTTGNSYNSVIDFKDAQLQIYFMFKNDDINNDYSNSDDIYSYLPESITNHYIVMSGYYNTTDNLYNMILEFNKFSRSPVSLINNGDGTFDYSIKEVPFFEFNYGIKNIVSLFDTFDTMLTTYSTLIKITTDFEVSLKFIATYGNSKYIKVTGGRDSSGNEINVSLNNLTPSLYFKVYGSNPPISDIYTFIYKYLRDTYITGTTIFISNICTAVEQNFSSVRSIKYLGVDNLDASYQEFTYNKPTLANLDIISAYIPEQLNSTDIKITLDET